MYPAEIFIKSQAPIALHRGVCEILGNRQAMPPAESPSLYDVTAVLGAHSVAKAVAAQPAPSLWLISSLGHCIFPRTGRFIKQGDRWP